MQLTPLFCQFIRNSFPWPSPGSNFTAETLKIKAMKTKILTLALLALMMGLSLNTTAGNEDTTRVNGPAVSKEFCACIHLYPDNIVKFLVENPDNDKVKLRIYNERGLLLYTYSFKKESIVRISFDISGLSNGKYDCVIERNREEFARKTIVKENDNE